MFANIKDKMHKQSTKERKYSKEYGNLKNSFFLSQRQADMLFIYTRFSNSKCEFFFF